MSSEDRIEMEGRVTKVLPGTKFTVVLTENGAELTCTMSGKLRINKIRILQDDLVTVSISPYDLTQGIIIWRSR